MGYKAIVPSIIISFMLNAFCEEALLRGFILKRIMKKCEFRYANTAQAFIFGILHIVFSIGDGMITYILIFTTTLIGGYMLGYINEKGYNGSILPSILLHGLGNTIVNIAAAFLII